MLDQLNQTVESIDAAVPLSTRLQGLRRGISKQPCPRAGANKQGHSPAWRAHSGQHVDAHLRGGLVPKGEGSLHVSQALGGEGSYDCVLFCFQTTSFSGKFRKIPLPSLHPGQVGASEGKGTCPRTCLRQAWRVSLLLSAFYFSLLNIFFGNLSNLLKVKRLVQGTFKYTQLHCLGFRSILFFFFLPCNNLEANIKLRIFLPDAIYYFLKTFY